MGPLWASQYGAAVRSLWGPYGVLASPYRCLYGVPMGSQCPPMGSLWGPGVTLWVFPYGVPMGSLWGATDPLWVSMRSLRHPATPQNPIGPHRTHRTPQNPIGPHKTHRTL